MCPSQIPPPHDATGAGATRGIQPGKRSSDAHNDPEVQDGARHGRSAPGDAPPRSAEMRTASGHAPGREPANDLVDRRAADDPADPPFDHL